MRDEQKSHREERRDPAKDGPFAGMMEDLASRCAEMMPDLMRMCGRTPDDHEEPHPRAGCCSERGGQE